MPQVRGIACRVVGEPLIGVGDSDLVEQAQRVAAASFSYSINAGRASLAHRRLARLAELERSGDDVPLDRVAEQVGQQEEALFRRHRVVDVDLGAIQVAGQWIGNVPGDHADAVDLLDAVCSTLAEYSAKRYHCWRT